MPNTRSKKKNELANVVDGGDQKTKQEKLEDKKPVEVQLSSRAKSKRKPKQSSNEHVSIDKKVKSELVDIEDLRLPFSKPSLSDVCENTDMKLPKNFVQIIENIRTMRKTRPAVVDTMGCHCCHDETASPSQQRWQKLVALMLSPQTKDEITFAAMGRLRERGLTMEAIANGSETDEMDKNPKYISSAEFKRLIHPVGFGNTKTKHIRQAAQICLEKFNGDIPDTVDGLCSLPGVGPKIAHLAMKSAWKKITGIAVDVHVHRITNR